MSAILSVFEARTPKCNKSPITSHCIACHGAEKPEGKLTMVGLLPQKLNADTAKTWQRVLEVLAFRKMPLAEVPQPKDADNRRITVWFDAKLTAAGYSSDDRHKLHLPAYVNLMNHEELYDGLTCTKVWSPSL